MEFYHVRSSFVECCVEFCALSSFVEFCVEFCRVLSSFVSSFVMFCRVLSSFVEFCHFLSSFVEFCVEFCEENSAMAVACRGNKLVTLGDVKERLTSSTKKKTMPRTAI